MGLDRENVLEGATSALIGECPQVEVVIEGVKMTGLLDTGSQTTLMRQSVLTKHFPESGVRELPSFIKLKAANGLKIPCLGYAIMDFEIEGHKIPGRGVFIVDDEYSSNTLIIGMNVVRACWDTVFKDPAGPVSFSCQNPKFQRTWREAFAVCRKMTVTTEDGFLGYIWPAQRKGITVPARSEVVVWGRTRAGPKGRDYCGLVEALPEPSAVSVARTLASIKQGRVPVRIRNLNEFPVSIGRYQKLGRLFQVEETDVHGARDVSLTPDEDGVVQVGLVENSSGVDMDSVFDTLGLADRPDLTSDEQGKLSALLQKWEKVFSKNEEDFGRTNIVQHQIPTGDAPPIRERFRPLPPLLYKDMRTLLSGMLQGGSSLRVPAPGLRLLLW